MAGKLEDRRFWGERAQELSKQLPLPTNDCLYTSNRLQPTRNTDEGEGNGSWYHAKLSSYLGDEPQWFGADLCRFELPYDQILPGQVVPVMPKPSKWSVRKRKKKQKGKAKRRKKAEDLVDSDSEESDQENEEAEEAKAAEEPTSIKPPAGKARKIRLFPSRRQKRKLNDFFAADEWTYNTCLTAVQAEPSMLNDQALRDYCVNKKAFESIPESERWVLNTPQPIREGAVRDLIQAYKTNEAKQEAQKARYRQDGTRPKRWLRSFEVKPRDRYKQASQSIFISAKHGWSGPGIIYPQKFGKKPIRASEPLPQELSYDSWLKRDRLGRFYLCRLFPLQTHDPSTAVIGTDKEGRAIRMPVEKHKTCIALDPGVRTFMTGYTPNGDVYEWGKDDYQKLCRLCKRYDSLQSRWSCAQEGEHSHGYWHVSKKTGDRTWKERRCNHRHRSHLKRAGRRMQDRIFNLVDELHKKMVLNLVREFHTILLPTFETSQMVNTATHRKIQSKTARSMLTWAHYRFRQRLVSKLREYPWCRLIVCSEHYTSKTCGHCGYVDSKLGSKRVFTCPMCGIKMDRDANAARNILIRYMVKRD